MTSVGDRVVRYGRPQVARRRRLRAGLRALLPISMVLGAAALLGCAEAAPGPSPEEALTARFPSIAPSILGSAGAARNVVAAREEGGALLLLGADGAGERPPLMAQFPGRGDQFIRFEGLSGAVIRVRELGLVGDAEPAGGAIAYPRASGTSFWTRTAAGYEEWLLLDAGVACPGVEVAAWEVAGASLRQRGDAIFVSDEAEAFTLRVTAPKAYAAGGREVPVKISIVGGRISIAVDAGCEAALVDPAWELVEPMLSARSLHTETLLPDGRVLVTGGVGSNSFAKATAELYTVAGDIWSAAASMAAARSGHRATLLASGKVLVTGGWSNGSSLATVELYDPLTNTWAPVAPMPNGRFHHAATRLASGKVLIAGGFGPLGSTPTSAELFDPATGTWKALPPMAVQRTWHTATLLPDGRVLVWGGPGLDMFPTQSTPYEIFDPATETWLATKQLDLARQRHTATLLPDGNVLIAGGEVDGVPMDSVQVFKPMTETRDFTTPMLEPRAGHTATLLESGNVLVAGGYSPSGQSLVTLTTTEIFYVTNTRWSFSAPLNSARHSHTATKLQDSRVLVVGGNAISKLASAEVYGSAIGEPCADVKDCPSGFCEDGVCCKSACDLGPCYACSVAAGALVNGECGVRLGAPCEDGLMCSVGEACDADGACKGGAPVLCEASGACFESACNPATGQCEEEPKPDGAPCVGGTCETGQCEPSGVGGGVGGGGGAGGAPFSWEPPIFLESTCAYDLPGTGGPMAPGWLLGALLALYRLRRGAVHRKDPAKLTVVKAGDFARK